MKHNYHIFAVDPSDSDLVLRIADNIDIASAEISGTIKMDTFSDGEFSPQFNVSIRDKKVFLVISTNTPEKILKLLLSIDAAKRASAKEIIAVIPYFGYGRQDKKEGPRGAIGAKLMADILQTAGADRLISIDLHSEPIQGFFDIPVNMIPGHTVFSPMIKHLPDDCYYCICSPDAGGVKRAGKFHSKFKKRFPDTVQAMLSKNRDKPNSIEKMTLISEGPIVGKTVIIVDDMVDTGGTLIKAAQMLKERGALRVVAVITHGVLSGDGVKKIQESDALDHLTITDSIARESSGKIEVVSCAPALAIAIEAIVHSYSFDERIETHE